MWSWTGVSWAWGRITGRSKSESAVSEVPMVEMKADREATSSCAESGTSSAKKKEECSHYFTS